MSKNHTVQPTEIDLRTFYQFPMTVDAPHGAYIFDAAHNMVADRGGKKFDVALLGTAVTALHALYDVEHASQGVLPPLAAPFRFNPEEDHVLDASGTCVLRIRGWGRLKYKGGEIARAVQLHLGAEFVRALDALYADKH